MKESKRKTTYRPKRRKIRKDCTVKTLREKHCHEFVNPTDKQTRRDKKFATIRKDKNVAISKSNLKE